MPMCFVMQPFDGGLFDKRYDDIFKPAIEAAGLTPYRVDRDPEVSIPIEQIEKGISESDLCFAEITTDNPNVWFELGYAIASRKQVCLVCSNERTKNFPFDVQHRAIITYETGSTSDYKKLGDKITARLKAIQNQQKDLKSIVSIQPTMATEGLLPHEITALALVMSNMEEEGPSTTNIKNDMEKAGYTDVAAALAVESLRLKGMVKRQTIQAGSYDSYTAIAITDKGVKWLLENQASLNLRLTRERKAASEPPMTDDDIPF